MDKKINEKLKELRLSTINEIFKELASKALKESVSYEQYLLWLLEQELEQRQIKSINNKLAKSTIPYHKNIETFDLKRFPMKLSMQIKSLFSGEFIKQKENILLFGNPGSGKTHILCAIGQELIRRQNLKILFISSSNLLQDLLIAKRDLILKKKIKNLLNYNALIIDDIGYIQQSKEEIDVLFTLIAECYEKISILMSSNLPFSQWDKIFKDPVMTIAVIDRLIHHSIIIEMNVNSYRLEKSKKTKTRS